METQPATSVPVPAPQNLAQPSQGQYSQSQPTPTPGTFSYFPVMPNQQSMGAASGMFPQMQGAQAPRPGYMPLMSAVNLGAQFPHEQAIPQQYTATSATAASPQAGLPQGPRAVYAYPVLNAPAGPACAHPAGAGAPRPTQYNNPNALAAAAAALATAEGVVVNCGASSPGGVPSGGLSPKAMRKLSHNAVEVRRRRRISMQLDRLKTMLNSPRADKASLLSEAVNRLTILTKKCHTLESELAVLKGRAPPEIPELPNADDAAGDDGAGDEDGEEVDEGVDDMQLDAAPAASCGSETDTASAPLTASAAAAAPAAADSSSGSSSAAAAYFGGATAAPAGQQTRGGMPPQQPQPAPNALQSQPQQRAAPGEAGAGRDIGVLQQAAQMAAASAAPQESRAHTAAVAAEQAELQLQRWAQWGETSLMELLHKDSHFEWNFVCTRDGIEGYSATLPPNQEPGADGQAVATTPAERLDYCVKSEATIDMDPATLAAIYMNVDERHKWHSACQDSRLVEEIWPNTMRIAIFTYRTELPVFPRGYCALIHRASHRLPDGRTQLVITDRSVSHPAMPASRHFIFMTVYPSGMLITPVQQGERTVSHVKLISHFHLRGTISPSLLQRIRANRMLEACCFNYLNEFRNHVRTCYQRAPEAPLPPPVVIKQDDEAQRPGEDQHLRPMACEASASDASHDCSRSDAAEALIQAASAAY